MMNGEHDERSVYFRFKCVNECVCLCAFSKFFYYFLLWISHYWPCGNFSEHYNNNNRGSSPRDDCNISSQRQYLTVTIANAPTSQAFRGAPVTP